MITQDHKCKTEKNVSYWLFLCRRGGAEHLHESLEHSDNDDTTKVHASGARDQHVEAGRGHDGEAEHSERERRR